MSRNGVTMNGCWGLGRGTRLRTGLVAVLLTAFAVSSLFGTPKLAGAAIPSEEFVVADVSSDKLVPSISGKIVVWEDNRDGLQNIYGKDLSVTPHKEFLVASGINVKRKPVTNGQVVVWEEVRDGNSNIYGYRIPADLSAAPGQPFEIAIGPGDQRKPSISGNRVIWEDNSSGKWEIYSQDLTSSTPTSQQITAGEGNKTNPSISGNTLVWQDDRGGVSAIYAKNLETGEEFRVSTSTSFQEQPSISGSIVVWQQESAGNFDIFGKDLYAKDLATGDVFQVTTNSSDQVAPAVSGTVVVWQDHRNGNADVYGKDLLTGQEFQISGGTAPQEAPAIENGTVVWEDQRTGVTNYGVWDIRGSNLDTAPAAPSGVKATGTDAGVNLAWTANGESDLAGYNVYRSGTQDGVYEKVNAAGLISGPSYSDAGAPKGFVSHYRITALDKAGNESARAVASGAALAPTSVTLDASPLKLDRGGFATFSGKLTRSDGTPLSDKTLILEKSAAGSNAFGPVANAGLKTGSDGTFRLANVTVDGSADYRVRFAGEPATGLKSSSSPTRQIQVTKPSSLILKASPSTLNLGKTTTLFGRLSEGASGLSGKPVILEHRPSGAAGFTQLGVKNTDANGNFSFSAIKPSRSTDYRVRFAGQTAALLEPSTSSVQNVGVMMPTALSVTASPTILNVGQGTTLSGRLTSGGTAVPGKLVILEHKPVGAAGFTGIRQTSTNTSGGFSFVGVRPIEHTDYRIRFGGNSVVKLQPSTSPAKRINARVIVTSKVSSAGVKVKQPLTISGMVTPAHTGTVTVVITGNGRVVTNTTQSLKQVSSSSSSALSNSSYSMVYRPPFAGTYKVQVSFAGHGDHLGNKSSVKTFRVTK